jgi:hypothetical protein
MKTKIAYVAALLIAGALVSWQKGPVIEPAQGGSEKIAVANGLPGVATRALEHYQVSLRFNTDVAPCGSYLVDIINNAGERVADPQVYSAGKDVYFFSEWTWSGKSVRIARLTRLLPPNLEEFCPSWMQASPDRETMNFSNGKTYYFNLIVKIM